MSRKHDHLTIGKQWTCQFIGEPYRAQMLLLLLVGSKFMGLQSCLLGDISGIVSRYHGN